MIHKSEILGVDLKKITLEGDGSIPRVYGRVLRRLVVMATYVVTPH